MNFSWNKTHWMFCYWKLNKIKHFNVCTHAEHSENKKLKYIFLLNQNFAMISTHPDSISLKASLIYHELYNRALLVAWIHTAAFFNKNARLIQSGWNVSYLRKNYLPNVFFGEKSAITIEGNVMEVFDWLLFTLESHDNIMSTAYSSLTLALLRLFGARKMHKQPKPIVQRPLEPTITTRTQKVCEIVLPLLSIIQVLFRVMTNTL